MRRLFIILLVLLFPCLVYADITTITSIKDGCVGYWGSSTYSTVRDATTGLGAYTADMIVGQRDTDDDVSELSYEVYRSFLAFPGIPSMASCEACTLYIDGRNNESLVDFGIYVHSARAYKSTLTTADYPNFNGRRAATTHNGTVLNNTWNTSSYLDGWNKIVFNAAGLDSVEFATGDTLWIALISQEDYNNSAPADNTYNTDGNRYYEQVNFNPSEGTPDPYLSINYTSAGWAGKVMGITNPTKIFGIANTGVTKVMGAP